MPALSLLTGPAAGLKHTLAAEATMGRSPSCEVPLDDPKASRRHAQVIVEAGRVVLRDLGSRNGTFLNGNKVEREIELRAGDRIQIGETVIRFEDVAEVAMDVSSASLESLMPEGELRSFLDLTTQLLAAPDRAAARQRLAHWMAQKGVSAKALSIEESAELPRALTRPALIEGQVALGGGQILAPLRSSGGEAHGVLVAGKEGGFSVAEQRLIASAAHLGGAAVGLLPDTARANEAFSPGLKAVYDSAREELVKTGRLALIGEDGSGRTQMARVLASELAGGAGWVEIDAQDPLALSKLEAGSGVWLLQRADACATDLASEIALRLRAREVKLISTCAVGRPMPAGLAPELDAHVRKVPALRDRTEDIPVLFARFVDRAARRRRQLPCRLSAEARRTLMAQPFPKNVSELRVLAEQLQLLYPGVELSPEHFSKEGGGIPKSGNLDARIAEVERVAIQQALREARGKKVRAAELLGISRPTLDKKISEYGLVVEKGRQ
jgi:DNA-binding protein Fis